MVNEVHHAFGEAATAIVDFEAGRVFGEPVEGFALEIESFELLLEGLDWDLVVRVTEDYVLYLVVHHPPPIA